MMKNQHNSNFDKILKKVVNNNLRKYIKENLKTHDDDIHNIYDKLDELDISYDFINERENIIEIRIPNKEIKNKILQLLNYYGWKAIKETDWTICAERVYSIVK